MGQVSMIAVESLLVLLCFVVLGVGMSRRGRQDGSLEALITAAGLAALLAGTFLGLAPEGTAFGGAWGVGPLAVLYKRIFLASGLLVTLLAWPGEPRPAVPAARLGETLALVLLSVTGMCVLASSRELVLLYTGLELVTIPAVALVAFHPKQYRSAEAGLKYVFTAALSSGILLYGLSLVYGMTGATDLAAMAARLPSGPLSAVALVMIMAGVGFKISAVPFHLWTPDTYEGAPVVVTAFLSVASKAAGFVLFGKAVGILFAGDSPRVLALVALLAVLTMTFGNLVALLQSNLKRFLAWSSIAQAGYLLVGLAAGGALGNGSVAYYLLVYLVSNLTAFAVVTLVAGATGREEMREYAGFSESNPRLAFAMMLALFSLGGIPPLAGFLGKFYLFAVAAQQGLAWLVLVAAVNSTVSLYYYLVVIRWMYIAKPEEGIGAPPPIRVHPAGALALAASTVGMILFGLVPHLLRWAEAAAAAGF